AAGSSGAWVRPGGGRDLVGAVRARRAGRARQARAAALVAAPRGAALALPAARGAGRRVGRRRFAAIGRGGGEEIQAPRPRRARLATALGALAVAAALAFVRPAGSNVHGLLLLALGGAGVLWLLVGLTARWNAALLVGIASL